MNDRTDHDQSATDNDAAVGNSRWTTADLPDLSGQKTVVTGANRGLGYETTAALARQGATVVMACRSIERGQAAAEAIRADDPPGTLDVRELDLADLDSVASFAEQFQNAYDDLHVLCNNAGVRVVSRSETTDGFETHFGVNHLGHFALTGHLLPMLRETDGETRVVTQSSKAHRSGDIDFDDLHGEHTYGMIAAYQQSKLANLLFAFELDRRLEAADVDDVVSTACHPGIVATNVTHHGSDRGGSALLGYVMKVANAIKPLIAQDARKGALPMLYGATAPDVTGGEYIGPDGFMGTRGHPHYEEPSQVARDPDIATRLWDVSVALTGVTYGLLTASDQTTESHQLEGTA